MKPTYYPNRGDVVLLDFTPQTGHEQAGRRPALVLSPVEYNRKVGLMLCCPITSQSKDYPFEVELSGLRTYGVVLSDQIKSLDWNARRVELKEKAPATIVQEVLAKAATLLS